MKKILVVEDDVSISNMLCDLLLHNSFSPTAAYSGTEALMCVKGSNFDLLLLDLMLPGKNGLDVLRELRLGSAVPVIALTAVSDKSTVVELLKAGANDYITKPFDNSELLARISVQFRGGSEAGFNGKLQYKGIVLDEERFVATLNEEDLLLSKIEYEILRLLMKNPKKVFTKNNIYEAAWGGEYLGDDNTVNVHISKIRNKIGKIDSSTEYIQTVWGIGFKMSE